MLAKHLQTRTSIPQRSGTVIRLEVNWLAVTQ